MLVCVRCRPVDGPLCRGIAIVVEHKPALVSPPVRVSEDIFVHRAVVVEEIIEQEVAALGKERSHVQQGSYFALMPSHQPVVRSLVIPRPSILHAVLLGESINLTVTE